MFEAIAKKFSSTEADTTEELNEVRQHDVIRLMKHVQTLTQQLFLAKVEIMQLRRLVDTEYVDAAVETEETYAPTYAETDAPVANH